MQGDDRDDRDDGTDATDAPAEGDHRNAGTDGPDPPVSVDIDIADGRTVVTVTGDRDAAVVVRSAGGERIYLPPEDFDRPPASAGTESDAHGTGPGPSDSPYQSATSDDPYQSPGSRDSPYQSPGESDSPYQRGGPPDGGEGLEPTADGFRIVHPEPVTDFRLLR
ncbi:hypothetical protein Hbl1158_10965 [Halobaculum sp. CBA1158]|uniref:DUF7510 family protein n=1 Tax=Halobaculum sp. CBA1158 TaxID=2904243 RepID=UPI001F19A761|nr:hypothetical protein [Halobaculum sp. CBA1158]UIO99052.1 hypothetical protein Hbl1158_10965 [Halobaculum sp. CBA1158]